MPGTEPNNVTTESLGKLWHNTFAQALIFANLGDYCTDLMDIS